MTTKFQASTMTDVEARRRLAHAFGADHGLVRCLVAEWGAARALEILRTQDRGGDLVVCDADALDPEVPLAEMPEGVEFLTPGHDAWPLTGEDRTAYLGLWARGDLGLLKRAQDGALAITGSRAATTYGEHAAADIASQITREWHTGTVSARRPILLGPAFGIEAAAARGILATDGAPIMATPAGLGLTYPAPNGRLIQQVAEAGVLLSATTPGCRPGRRQFARYADLVVRMSDVLLVVEASEYSLTRQIAHRGHDRGALVLGVPGPVTSAASQGVHHLVRDGIARVVTDAHDVLDDIARRDLGSAATDGVLTK